MRMITLALAVTMLLSITTSLPAQQGRLSEVGRLHRIDIKSQHPKAYHPAIGDLVKCYLDFPVVPEQIVDDLQVTIKGKSLLAVGVINTSKPKIVGSGQVSLFLMPRQLGLTKVTILPSIPGQETKPIEITFNVGAQRRY